MQEEVARRARPDGVNAMGHDEATQRRMGLDVLQAAHVLAAAETGVVQHPRMYCLEAGQGGIASHYAIRLLGPLEARPHAALEVLALLEAGIRNAGGTPPPRPPPPKPPPRKRGPKVSTAKPSTEEVQRRRALVAAALERLRPLVPFAALLAGE